MLSDSGASDRPACMALYSSTICRKIGSAIIVPPSAICCIICRRCRAGSACERNRSGSISAGLPGRLRRTSHQASAAERDGADRDQGADRLAALLPHEDAEHDAAHADDRQDRADDVDAAVAGVLARRGRARCPTARRRSRRPRARKATRHDR